MKTTKIIAAGATLILLAGIFAFFYLGQNNIVENHQLPDAEHIEGQTVAPPTNKTSNTILPGKPTSSSVSQASASNKNKAALKNTVSNPVAMSSTNSEDATQEFVDPKTLTTNPRGILLQRGGFDTSLGTVKLPENLTFDNTAIQQGELIRYLVQFTGPVLPEWKEEVVYRGGDLGKYIPNNAFIVVMTAAEKDLVAQLSFVQWVGYYHPAYKISKSLLDNSSEILAQAHRPDTNRTANTSDLNVSPDDPPSVIEAPDDTSMPTDELVTLPDDVLLTVQTFSSGKLPLLYSLAESLDSAIVIDSSDNHKSRVLIEVKSGNLNDIVVTLAQEQEVEWVEPYVPPVLNNNQMHWVVQSNINNENPLWNKGLTGAGQIVGVGDTGLDIDMVFFWDASQGIPGPTVNMNQRKVISYHDLAGNGDWDGHDHGTHVAGTIAGKSLGTNSSYNGVAYDAKLVFQDIGYGGSLTGIPYDLNTYFQQAYNDGARIHSNSWGSAVGGAYTTSSQDADEFMWNHKDFLVVFSAGNSGSSINTIGSPGTAKNVLTSGASENANTGYDQNNVAYFSSNGPTDDGRIKPTVTAPGHYISSANNDLDITTFNSDIRTMSGTSMSAPTHAGSAALVRQYFMDGFYPSGAQNGADSITPSAALIKATMVNSSANMTGNYIDGPIPSTGQGWGRILLDNSLFFAGDGDLLYVDDFQAGLATNQEKSYNFYSNGTEPIKVSLVWTDYYPALAAAVQIVNDLDLTVTGPSTTFKGNVFANAASVTGGDYDRLNILENVLLINPEQGVYTVTVKGYNVPNGPQPYALVVTGLSSGSSTGTISLDKPFYQPGSTAVITVTDLDLDISGGLDSATVHISSTSDAGQDLQLTETGTESGTFSGSFVVNSVVQVNAGDTITASYVDTDDGQGGSGTVTDTAVIDLTFPEISAIQISGITHDSATITWSTDEQTTSAVLFRKKGDNDWNEKLSTASLNHSVQLDGLTYATLYEVAVIAVDQAGNESTDDNGGSFYELFTDIVVPVLSDSVVSGSSLFKLSGGSNDAGEYGMWHITDYKSSSTPSSWYYGLEATKNYETGLRNWGHITTINSIDLTGLENAELRFKHILKTEDSIYYDIARVQVSEDNAIFTTVFQSVKSLTDWEEISVDLDAYVGKTIYIRFFFDTIDGVINNYEGWLVDDIRIVTFVPDDGIAPGKPVGIGISDPGDNSLVISWDANTEFDLAGYNIYRDNIQTNSQLVTETVYNDSGLTQGSDYSYTITAVDKSGKESVKSTEVSATAGKPISPQGLAATSGNEQVVLSWNANSEADLTGYNVYRKTEGDGTTDLALASSGATVISAVTNPGALIDGITNDYNGFTYQTFPCNMDVDLGQVNYIGKVGVHLWDGVPRYYRYTVSVSVDGITYTQVVDRSVGLYSGYNEDVFAAVPARYVRVRGLYNSANNTFHLKELKVFATASLIKINPDMVTNTNFTISSLDNAQEYQFAIAANDSFGNQSSLSEIVTGVPDDGIAPVAPLNPVVSDPGDNSLGLAWTANSESDLAGYNIYRNNIQTNAQLVTENVYSDSGLTQGSDYSYTITAVDKAGKESVKSSEVTATAGKPTAPQGLSATSGNEQVVLSWNANSEADLAGYNVYSKYDGDGTTDLALASSGATVISAVTNPGALIDGVTNDNNSFTYQTFPCNMDVDLGQVNYIGKVGVHLWDGVPRYYRYTVSVSVDGTTYTQVVDRSVDLYSGYNEDVFAAVPARYVRVRGLYNSANNTFHLKELKVFATASLIKINPDMVTNTNFTISSLDNAQEYQFAIAANDSFGNQSSLSEIVTGVPDDGIAPVAPLNPVVSDPGDNSLGLAWTANSESDLAGYNIYRNNIQTNGQLVTENVYSDSGLTQGSDYSYTIAAVDKAGKESVKSSEVTTTAGKPTAPQGLSATSGNEQVVLSWNANSEADLAGYNVYSKYDGDGTTDLALASSGATVISAVTNPGALIDGVTNDNNSFTYQTFPCNMDVDLGQVNYIGKVGVHLWDGVPRYYRYTVSVSVDGTTYTQVVDRSVGLYSGYNEDVFAAVPARYVRVRGLYNSANNTFHLKELKVFATASLIKINPDMLTNTNFTISSLDNAQEYQFAIAANDSFGNQSSLSEIVTGVPDDGIAPVAPLNPVVSDPGDNSLGLAWTANSESDLAGYNIYRDNIQTNSQLVTENLYNDSGLTQGSDYSYTITAVDKAGKESVKSSEVTATAGKPTAPQGLSATSGNEQVVLSWNANSEADLAGYNVYSKYDGDGTTDLALASSGATVISAVTNPGALIDGVTNDSNSFTYQTFPCNMDVDLGQVNYIGKVGVHLWDGVPRYYRYTVSVSVDGITYTQVVDRSVGLYSGYNEDVFAAVPARYVRVRGLYNSANNTFHLKELKVFATASLIKINPDMVTNTNFTISSLDNAQEYQFAIAANDSFGNQSSLSEIVTGVPDDGIAPVAPLNPVVSDPGDNSLGLAWTANSESDLAGYNIYRNNIQTNAQLVTENVYSDSGLTQGSDYSYTITAVDKAGKESVKSSEVTATAGKPTAPQGLSATSGNEQVVLSWNANSEADLAGYNVYSKYDGDGTTDLALASSGATVISAVTNPGALIDGVTNDYNGFTYQTFPCNMDVDLGQVNYIGKVGVHLWDGVPRYYRYTVSVSVDGTTYTQVVDRSVGLYSGYNEDVFAAVPARYVRVRGLYNSANNTFHLKELKVFATASLIKVNSDMVTNTNFTISSLDNAQEYQFAIAANDSFGNQSSLSEIVLATPSLDSNGESLPDEREGITDLNQNNILDTDGDGLSDTDEVNLYATDPLKSDSDGDGISDWQEIQDGTDPNMYSPVTASPDPAFENFTWTLPADASLVRLNLLADIDQFLFSYDAGLTGFGQHPQEKIEGLEYVWIDLQSNATIKSWADGKVTNLSTDEDGLSTITLDYGSNLKGWHGHIASTNLVVGDVIVQGQAIGFGQSLAEGVETSVFGLIDLGRKDGPPADGGGVYVSPFDYLTDVDKRLLVDKYKLEVADLYDPADESTKMWGFEPYQPYLTNRFLLHEGSVGKLSGVWRIKSSAVEPGYPNDMLTFIEAETPYFTGNVVMSQDQEENEPIGLQLNGTFEIDYNSGHITIHTEEGTTYYGIFEINENAEQPVLSIEYQEDTYPENFTGDSLTYQLAE